MSQPNPTPNLDLLATHLLKKTKQFKVLEDSLKTDRTYLLGLLAQGQMIRLSAGTVQKTTQTEDRVDHAKQNITFDAAVWATLDPDSQATLLTAGIVKITPQTTKGTAPMLKVVLK